MSDQHTDSPLWQVAGFALIVFFGLPIILWPVLWLLEHFYGPYLDWIGSFL